MTSAPSKPRGPSWWRRPLGRPATLALAFVICLAPAWLFADLLENYFIYGDDWEYIVGSRTFARTVENLFTPHNVHVVPVWRLVSWVCVALAGGLTGLQKVLPMEAYGALAATMLLAGRLVMRETGRITAGLAAMVMLGTASTMMSAGTWFSASQATGAGFGILCTLWYAQSYRRAGGVWRLGLAILSAWLAAGCWSVGHAAGPVAAVYLWVDGRPRCRWAAPVLVIAGVVAAGGILWVGGKAIAKESKISFHGRQTSDAVRPKSGALLTIQAVPERLLAGDLGLVAETTFWQGATLVLALAVIWAWTRRGSGPISPMEAAGAAMVACTYFLEWTFRGYLPFSSLRGFVPWYDAIPQIGASLFAASWWAQLRAPVPKRELVPITRGAAVALLGLQLGLIVLNQPRVDAYFMKQLHHMSELERKKFPIHQLQRLRAVYLAAERSERQQRLLVRLHRAEEMARRMGVGRDALVSVFGHRIWPDPPQIEDADLLDLPRTGSVSDPQVIRQALGGDFALEIEPRPPWIPPEEPWPPR